MFFSVLIFPNSHASPEPLSTYLFSDTVIWNSVVILMRPLGTGSLSLLLRALANFVLNADSRSDMDLASVQIIPKYPSPSELEEEVGIVSA